MAKQQEIPWSLVVGCRPESCDAILLSSKGDTKLVLDYQGEHRGKVKEMVAQLCNEQFKKQTPAQTILDQNNFSCKLDLQEGLSKMLLEGITKGSKLLESQDIGTFLTQLPQQMAAGGAA